MINGLSPLGGSKHPTNAFLVRNERTESTLMSKLSYLDQEIRWATLNGDVETIVSLHSERDEFSKKLNEIKNNLKKRK